ncbi:MAG: hypothetical protein O3B42_08695 [Actinomycetota bacterium]|nr:hypothetical protein [Actinomycetota bacterium]
MTSIDRSDLEAKLREIEGVVTDVEDEARSNALAIVVIAGVVIGIAALIMWRTKQSKIRIEVYRQ